MIQFVLWIWPIRPWGSDGQEWCSTPKSNPEYWVPSREATGTIFTVFGSAKKMPRQMKTTALDIPKQVSVTLWDGEHSFLVDVSHWQSSRTDSLPWHWMFWGQTSFPGFFWSANWSGKGGPHRSSLQKTSAFCRVKSSSQTGNHDQLDFTLSVPEHRLVSVVSLTESKKRADVWKQSTKRMHCNTTDNVLSIT